MRIWAVALLHLTLVGASVHAQSSPAVARPGALDSARRVTPGDNILQGARLATRAVQYQLTAYRDADEIPVGRLIDSLRIDTIAGTALVHRVQRLQRGGVQLIDSSVTELVTLAPRSHRSIQPNRRIRLDFAGRRVRGSLGPQDLPPVPIDTLLPAAAFDSGNWDLLLRALPLAQGLSVRFPVYDVDAGLHQYHVAVTGRAVVQGEEAYVVIFTLARGRESVVWIGMTSGELLRMETMLDASTLLRQERVVPSGRPSERSSERPSGPPTGARSPRSR